jgi:hypothetical protein
MTCQSHRLNHTVRDWRHVLTGSPHLRRVLARHPSDMVSTSVLGADEPSLVHCHRLVVPLDKNVSVSTCPSS